MTCGTRRRAVYSPRSEPSLARRSSSSATSGRRRLISRLTRVRSALPCCSPPDPSPRLVLPTAAPSRPRSRSRGLPCADGRRQPGGKPVQGPGLVADVAVLDASLDIDPDVAGVVGAGLLPQGPGLGLVPRAHQLLR